MSRITPDQVIVKTPSEKKFVELDFVDDIPSGDSIKAIGGGSSTGVTAVDNATGASATSTVIDTPTVSGTKLQAKLLKAGTAGVDYLCTFRVEINTRGDIVDKFVLLKVRDAPVVL